MAFIRLVHKESKEKRLLYIGPNIKDIRETEKGETEIHFFPIDENGDCWHDLFSTPFTKVAERLEELGELLPMKTQKPT